MYILSSFTYIDGLNELFQSSYLSLAGFETKFLFESQSSPRIQLAQIFSDEICIRSSDILLPNAVFDLM